jgi:hypothetical protein
LNVSTGNITAYISLYPDQSNTTALWSTSGKGLLSLKLKQTDPNFHINTYYYLTLISTQPNTTVSFYLSQNKRINYLDSNVFNKGLLWDYEDYVKYYVVQVPTNASAINSIMIVPTTDSFYPTVYLMRNELQSNITDFRQLRFPSTSNYTIKFGDDLSYYLNQ